MRLLAGLLSLCLVAPLFAGEFNKKLNIGDNAPAWKNLPGVDGKNHSLADIKDRDYVVVIFTCNSCACSEEYEDRIVAFTQKYADRVAVVAINVNTIPEDKLDAMKKKAAKKKFTFPYLYDETQQIARDYGATYTPEFFVLNKERKIAYMGAMDDKTNVTEVKDKYLEAATDAILAGKTPPKAETVARGCLIRFKRVRVD
ncbi:thioredoxin family protein [Zavarzinella formosa]|uniref:thioredoxin family protein n=1 Tax=Zavarzinella formosa TaxID=360055 RepID=UPI0003055AAF|nr:thioredoxin family protein [Zavarzinella formosa]